MRLVRYRPNPLFEEEARAQPDFEKGKRKITKDVARVVRRLAPHRTGYYMRRVRAFGDIISAGDPFWHLVEFGSANNPPYGPLRRGVRAAGLRLVVRPKP